MDEHRGQSLEQETAIPPEESIECDRCETEGFVFAVKHPLLDERELCISCLIDHYDIKIDNNGVIVKDDVEGKIELAL